MATPIILENDVGEHTWPEWVEIGRARLFLIDDTDVTLRPLWEGYTVLGWAGDKRLRVYACPLRGTYELVRYEANGTYTSCSRVSVGAYRTVDMVALWIEWLVTHDARRGFDPVADTEKHNAKLAATTEQTFDEAMTEHNHHLGWGLRKDGVDLFGARFPVGDTSNIGGGDSTLVAEAPA